MPHKLKKCDRIAARCGLVPADRGRPQVCHTHEQIDAYGASAGQQVCERAHAALDAAIERYEALMGDAELIVDHTCGAEQEAWEELLSTPPTSMAGVRGLLAYPLREVDDIHFRLCDLSVAALNIHRGWAGSR
jgi:hypothetical protein